MPWPSSRVAPSSRDLPKPVPSLASSFNTLASKAQYISKPQTNLASLSSQAQLSVTKASRLQPPTAKPPPPPPPKKHTKSSNSDYVARCKPESSDELSSALQFADDTVDDYDKV